MGSGAVVEQAQEPDPRPGRGLTIRLKLTLWYGSLFLLAGVLLIAINFVLVRDSLEPAQEQGSRYVEEQYDLEPGDLEPGDQHGGPGAAGEMLDHGQWSRHLGVRSGPSGFEPSSN